MNLAQSLYAEWIGPMLQPRPQFRQGTPPKRRLPRQAVIPPMQLRDFREQVEDILGRKLDGILDEATFEGCRRRDCSAHATARTIRRISVRRAA